GPPAPKDSGVSGQRPVGESWRRANARQDWGHRGRSPRSGGLGACSTPPIPRRTTMAIYSLTNDNPSVLQHVVSELRWLLAHAPALRAGVTRIVRRYEDQLHGAQAPGRAAASGRRRLH